jgi:hypothetical protein
MKKFLINGEESEQKIQKDIMDYLKLKKYVVTKHRNVGIKKPNGKYIPLPDGEKGVSDIIACSPDGRFIAIEVKRPGGVVSEDQKNFIKRVSKTTAVAFVAYSLDDVMKIL